MSVIATFYLETPVLRRALRDVPDMSIAVEQQTATDASATTMVFWAGDGDFAAFEDGLDADPTVTDPTLLADVDGTRLYQVRLTEEGEEVVTYQSWANLGAVFLSSSGRATAGRSSSGSPTRRASRSTSRSAGRTTSRWS